MIHKMKLQSKYFDFMLRGTKRIEIRLNDEKRQLIKIGDIIEFERFSELNDSFKTRVVELIKYNNFDELVKDFDISILADKSMTKSELINELIQFYPEEKQQKYGVLAIRIELI
ncbi:MAG: ASCH domain-containing protein [Bacilli bacterium]